MTKQSAARQAPPVLVHPLMEGMRLVKIHGQSVGKARSLEDLKSFLAQSGLRDVDVDNPALVEWHGGGSGVWNV
ncbi:hypothetical protein GCM10010218_52910 [Streptomyces mashuensis]|uniref:Uncharacterized protein n=1 Tax=Streptomyces mashuensis TaxID=33904 RepID=A0A919B7Q4_9ACTN|nr:hypothetical protein [Streptomyces mashuensis]GHF64873.1 hypothetical protein GCM10010218_52910 [Streptomyces mashuensis]